MDEAKGGTCAADDLGQRTALSRGCLKSWHQQGLVRFHRLQGRYPQRPCGPIRVHIICDKMYCGISFVSWARPCEGKQSSLDTHLEDTNTLLPMPLHQRQY